MLLGCLPLKDRIILRTSRVDHTRHIVDHVNMSKVIPRHKQWWMITDKKQLRIHWTDFKAWGSPRPPPHARWRGIITLVWLHVLTLPHCISPTSLISYCTQLWFNPHNAEIFLENVFFSFWNHHKCLLCWPNIIPTLGQRLVFAGF